MRSLFFALLSVALTASATELFDRNLAYSSPFVGFPEVRHLSHKVYETIDHIHPHP